MSEAAGHVVVIGAGAVGVATAIHTLRLGYTVTLIDPGEPGGEQAASYGNAGWLSSHSVVPPSMPGLWRNIPGMLADRRGALKLDWSHLPKATPWLLAYLRAGWSRDKVSATAAALRPLLLDAPALHGELAGAAGVADLVERRGVLHAYTSREAFQAEAMAWDIRRECGIDWTELNARTLHALEPQLAEKYQFAVRVEEAGRCLDPGRYVAALSRYVRTLGGDIRKGKVWGFDIDNAGSLRSVRTDAGALACDKAVVAAGIRSKALAAAAGDRLPLASERGYHVMIANPAATLQQTVMLGDAKIVVNPMALGLRASGQVEIAAVDAPPDWRRSDLVLNGLLAAIPNLGSGEELEVSRWMGHRPSFPDALPCIGTESRSADIVYAFGHGHVGLTAAARTGRLAAQLTAGMPPEISLAPYSPQRFGR